MAWLVKHREGTCATKSGQRHAADAASVETLCGQYVVLPLGSERGTPDCDECRTEQRKIRKAQP